MLPNVCTSSAAACSTRRDILVAADVLEHNHHVAEILLWVQLHV
jgi:hypothetical protein